MSLEWIETHDGSISCRDIETGQVCHNLAGAYLEAQKMYCEPADLAGLMAKRAAAKQSVPKEPIRILDACYGLGYNTWVTIDQLLQQAKAENWSASPAVSVLAIEKSPDMVRNSPLIFGGPTFDTLKERISPLEHNTYYRTLQCLLDNKIARFKIRLVEKQETFNKANPVISSLGFEFYVLDSNNQWLLWTRAE